MPSSQYNYATVLLCTYGFFKEFIPSQPFLTPYLKGLKNLTVEQLDEQVYPIWTYAYLVVLFIVFFITDILHYKPIIITEALAYLAARILLIWGMGVLSMQLMQVACGVATGTEVAYYTYIYAAVERKHFQKVTSYTRAGILIGRMTAGIVGQLLISLHVTSYLTLNYISFVSIIICLIISIVLPSAKGNAFVITNNVVMQQQEDNNHLQIGCLSSWKMTMKSLYNDFLKCYKKKELLKWSIWWAFSMCGVLLIENFIQILWDHISPSYHHHVYNGGVYAVSLLVCSVVAFLLAYPKINWAVFGELCLGLVSVLDAFLLYTMARTSSIWVAYGTYIIFWMAYTFLITIASYQIAINVEQNRYALVFGFNSFVAVSLQTIITLIVNNENGLHFGITTQFVVYGCYFFLIGGVFLSMAFVTMTTLGWRECWNHRFVQGPPPRDYLPNTTINTSSQRGHINENEHRSLILSQDTAFSYSC